MNPLRDLRIGCYKDTKERAASYPYKPSKKIKGSLGYISMCIHNSTQIEVTQEDSIVAGIRLKDANFDPLVLNFANDLVPGGGVENGAGAQEESLFRRTNLCVSMPDSLYPIKADEAIYTPKATVFKDTEANGYTYLKTPKTLSFIAAPGLNHPPLVNNRLTPEGETYFERKIRLIFQVAKENGHDSLILGPLGCGAWACPPKHVAQIFLQVCDQNAGVFQKIVFACYSRPENPDQNYEAFQAAFTYR